MAWTPAGAFVYAVGSSSNQPAGPQEERTLVMVQSLRPDRFFTAAQQQRLDELMMRWRTLRDQGTSLPAAEQAELEALVAAELQASSARAAELADPIQSS